MSGKPAIYLDHNATTPCDPRVVEAMLPFFGARFANPASREHAPGRDAFAALEAARATVAACLGARSATEIVFVSGATEANNLALRGAALTLAERGRHLVSQATEHPSVLMPLERLRREGFAVTLVDVGEDGRVRLDELERALRPDTTLVSLMLVNGETGVVQPVAEAATRAHRVGALVHVDAAQAVGRIPVDVAALGVDLLSCSGHKVYGPKGIGALYRRRRTPPLALMPLLEGGGHEYGVRAGTVNLPAVIGFACALEIARAELPEEGPRLASLRDRFERALREALPDLEVHGREAPRAPGTSSVLFPGVDATSLLAAVPELALSTGAACSSGRPSPSSVLLAMGVDPARVSSSVRIALGRGTTADEVDRAAGRLATEASRLGRLGDRSRGR